MAFYTERNEAEDAPKGTGRHPDKYTYKEALAEVNRIANVLKGMGVGKGDRVGLFLPMVAELPLAMLACARIGAVHTVVFAGFSKEALASRLVDAGCKAVKLVSKTVVNSVSTVEATRKRRRFCTRSESQPARGAPANQPT